ncbi:MAG: two-component system sensor histidine kinase NtrB [Bacilli bacterium]
MRLRSSLLLITSVVVLAAILLGLLVFVGYSETGDIVEHNYNIALGSSAVQILKEITPTLEWTHPTSTLTVQLRDRLHSSLYFMDQSGLQILQIGAIGMPSHSVLAVASQPGVSVLDIRPLWLGAVHRQTISEQYYSHTLHTSIYEAVFPVVVHQKYAGAIYVAATTQMIVSQLDQILAHEIVIALLVCVITVAAGLIIWRVIHLMHREPSTVANWVHALTVDPMAARPRSLYLLDPLTDVILDMRSRLFLQEALLKGVIDNAPLAIIHVTLDGRCETVNEAFSKMCGLQADEACGRSIGSVAQSLGIDRELTNTIITQLQRGVAVRNMEVTLTHAVSKELRHVQLAVSPTYIATSGAITGFAIFADDITTRKQWESYTTRTDRLSLIAELAASTAHEIRNPLTTVRGFLQLQKKRNPPSEGRDYFQIMIEEIDRVDGLISEYLTLARNSMNTDRAPVEIASIIADLLPLITAEANMKGVVVNEFDLPDGYCMANKSELKQVFLNLSKNALDAMSSGGELSLKATVDGSVYTVIISDTGSGIDPVHLHHIFAPFYTTKSTGSGLGLSVSKKIVESHQGEIQVESHPGIGSTFFVSLPLNTN